MTAQESSKINEYYAVIADNGKILIHTATPSKEICIKYFEEKCGISFNEIKKEGFKCCKIIVKETADDKR